MQDIKTILELIKTDSSVMDVERDGLSLVSLLLEIAEADIESEDGCRAVETIERIRNANNKTTRIAATFSIRLASIGMAAYSAKMYSVAEIAYRMIAESGDTSAKNNYAYMIRRHEIAAPSNRDHVLALRMLQVGVKEGDAFSLVNTALVFALVLGDDDSWHLADSIFERLSGFGGMLVSSWWEDLAKEGDDEGFLVIFFLLRHEKIEHSDLGSIKSIALRLAKNIGGFPEWLAKDYAIETLDDVIECLDDPDFDTILEDFLEQMPCSRESVEEMLETVSALDLWPVYNKLLTDCVALLSPEELAKLKADYTEKFSIPLPDEVE